MLSSVPLWSPSSGSPQAERSFSMQPPPNLSARFLSLFALAGSVLRGLSVLYPGAISVWSMMSARTVSCSYDVVLNLSGERCNKNL